MVVTKMNMQIKEAMDLLELLRRLGYKGRIEQADRNSSFDEKLIVTVEGLWK